MTLRSTMFSVCLSFTALSSAVWAQSSADPASPASYASSSRQASPTSPTPKITFVVQNRDFVKYKTPKRKTPGPQERVEVLYFYYVGSPWTQRIDHSIRAWAQTRPYAIKFISVPVYFDNNPYGVLGARVHYALTLLKEDERVLPLFVEAVAKKHVNLNVTQSILSWMEDHGISQERFLKALNDPRTKSSTMSIPFALNNYEVRSMPTVVLDGQYIIASNEQRTPERMLEIAKFMTDKLSEGGKRP